MSIVRNIEKIIKPQKKSVLLIGPRQTGKSTLIRSLKPDLEINLADESTFLQHLTDPTLLRKMMGKHKKIFIDEVQRIPSLLNTVQSILDVEKDRQFFLTGSSARKLKRGKANLLPGRILSYELGPLTVDELQESFDLEISLRRGLLPGIYLEESQELAEKVLRTYASTYLKEEIQAEALTRNLEGFSRFFEVMASRSGSYLDVSKFSSQAMIERTTSKRYFDVLVDTLVVTSVEAFAKSEKRRLIQHPKFYFFDVGVLNACLKNFVVSADRIGNLFEHLVLQILVSTCKSKDLDYRISTYRTESGAEVDFILEVDKQVFAIEVKASKNIGSSDFKGLQSFRKYYGKKHTPIVIYLGEHSLEIEDIFVLPLAKALKEIF